MTSYAPTILVWMVFILILVMVGIVLELVVRLYGKWKEHKRRA